VPAVYEKTSWGLPLRNICHIGVVVFVMISGYYGIRRKWSRLLELALTVSFYNILGILVATLCFNQHFEVRSLLSVFIPITKGGYWFITTYVVLYLIAPYINMVLEKLPKRDFLLLLIVLGIIVWYGGGIWSNDIGHGRGIMAFILSYCIGSFIKKFYNTEAQKFVYWGGAIFDSINYNGCMYCLSARYPVKRHNTFYFWV
jgi:surface polysaccharide O-acyltransferase-like enzyme